MDGRPVPQPMIACNLLFNHSMNGRSIGQEGLRLENTVVAAWYLVDLSSGGGAFLLSSCETSPHLRCWHLIRIQHDGSCRACAVTGDSHQYPFVSHRLYYSEICLPARALSLLPSVIGIPWPFLGVGNQIVDREAESPGNRVFDRL